MDLTRIIQDLLEDKDGGVRCIVAYHGVKQHSAKQHGKHHNI